MTGVAVSQKRCPGEIRKPASGSLIAIADQLNQTEMASVRETALMASVREAPLRASLPDEALDRELVDEAAVELDEEGGEAAGEEEPPPGFLVVPRRRTLEPDAAAVDDPERREVRREEVGGESPVEVLQVPGARDHRGREEGRIDLGPAEGAEVQRREHGRTPGRPGSAEEGPRMTRVMRREGFRVGSGGRRLPGRPDREGDAGEDEGRRAEDPGRGLLSEREVGERAREDRLDVDEEGRRRCARPG